MMEVAGSNPNNEREPLACSRFPLSSRASTLTDTVEDSLKQIGKERAVASQPVYEMLSSLVTIALPRNALDFNQGKLATSFNPTLQGPPLGDLRLRTAIAEQRQSNFNSPITAENVFITSGARTALHAVLSITMDSQSGLILMPPHFGRFMGIAQLASVVVQQVPLDRDRNFQPDIEGVEREWNPMTRAMLVANPNNPTGTVMNTESLVQLREIAERNRGYLIVDETFEAFDFTRWGRRSNRALDIRNSIVIGSFSERYSIPDHRVGYVIANPEIVDIATRVTKHVSFGTPMHVQELVIDLLKGKQEHLERILPIIRQRQTTLQQALLSNRAIENVYGEAGTFVWAVPAKHQRIDCRATAFTLAHKYGVLVMPGAEYGAPGCFRIGLGQISDPQRFSRACEILSNFREWSPYRNPAEELVPQGVRSTETDWGAPLKHPVRSAWTHPGTNTANQPRPTA